MSKKFGIIILYFLLCACSIQTFKTQNSEAAQTNAKLALAYLEQNNAARGKEKLLFAQKQSPSDPSIWYVSGYFLERTGDMAAANKAYLHAIQLAPRLGAAQNNYGAFLCRQGKYNAAISHFLLAVQDPNYLNTAQAYENAARCALKIPNRTLADKYFRLALERSGHF